MARSIDLSFVTFFCHQIFLPSSSSFETRIWQKNLVAKN